MTKTTSEQFSYCRDLYHNVNWYQVIIPQTMQTLTSCVRGDTICLLPGLHVDNSFVFIQQVALLFWHNNIFVFIRQVAPVPVCWPFKTSATADL